MQWWAAGVLAVIVGFSTYNYGYKRGMSASPEFSALKLAEQEGALIRERLRVEAIQRAAPDPEACLPIVLDGSIDLDGFCRQYLTEQERRIFDEIDEAPDQEWGR